MRILKSQAIALRQSHGKSSSEWVKSVHTWRAQVMNRRDEISPKSFRLFSAALLTACSAASALFNIPSLGVILEAVPDHRPPFKLALLTIISSQVLRSQMDRDDRIVHSHESEDEACRN